MKVLDLFSGLGGFSQAFKDRRHDVILVDIEESFKPTVVADLRKPPFRYRARYFDVILASPPCDEFTKAGLPWYSEKDYNIEKGMELVRTAIDIIRKFKPRFWVLENVRGSVPYISKLLGKYRQRCGSRYLWGNFPVFNCNHGNCYGKWKLPPSKRRKALRSKIPYEISLKLCLAIEGVQQL